MHKSKKNQTDTIDDKQKYLSLMHTHIEIHMKVGVALKLLTTTNNIIERK